MQAERMSFFARLAMAFSYFFRILSDGFFAANVQLLPGKAAQALPAARPPAEQVHASGLFVLGLFQREGRLIDFLQEDVAAFSDGEVGAAARVVHEGCRKVLRQYLQLEPVLPQVEGDAVNVPLGFDAQRIRLTGNVAGSPPFQGALKHHGWVATTISLPPLPEAMEISILAPAEVELS